MKHQKNGVLVIVVVRKLKRNTLRKFGYKKRRF